MAAYTGAGAEKISYRGLLSKEHGFVCGEIPAIPGLVASGSSEDEVRNTLQGPLEMHIEEMLDEDEVLPEDIEPPNNKYTEVQTELFHVVVPNTARRSVLASFHDHQEITHHHSKSLSFKAVILEDRGMLHGHFPDLTGAFTSGSSIPEIQAKLQTLLETYIGLMIKSREEIPPARFAHASELNMSEEELKRTPIVGLPTLTVEVPF